MKFDLKKKILFLSLFVLFAGSLHAQPVGPNPSSGNTGITYECPPQTVNGVTVYGNCSFQDFINEVRHLIDFAVVDIVLPLTVVVIAIAGGKYMYYSDNANKRKEANEMLLKVVVGIAIIMAAWLIVHLITDALLKSGYSNIIPTSNGKL